MKGNGIEFADVRPWRYGDMKKSIDPKMTSKKQEHRVREFDEEKQLALRCINDVENTMKYPAVQQIMYALGYAAIKNNDKVGLIDGNSTIALSGKFEILPKLLDSFNNKQSKYDFLKYLLVGVKKKAEKNSLSKKLSQCVQMKMTGGLIVIVSDSLDADLDKLHYLGKQNEILWIQIVSEQELKIKSNNRYIRFTNDSKNVLISMSNKNKRKQYYTEINKVMTEFQNKIELLGGRYLSISTEDDIILSLRKFFTKKS